MIDREFTCIVCPKGCQLHVYGEVDGLEVRGNTCPGGEVHAKQEIEDPRRNISSTIRVIGGFLQLVPVKTSNPIPKDKIFDVMEQINTFQVDAPVFMGQVLIKDVLGTGVDIVATRDICESTY
ncbi:DUF1667 domain-containing protein [Peptoniphilaceae bacterium SGI.131]